MSKKTAIEITIEPDNHTLENIKWRAEVENKTIEEVAKSYLVTGAINESLSEVVQVEIGKGIETIRGDLKADSDRIYDKLEQLEQQLDSLETTIEKVLEQLD